ncbi:methyltransferase domain-containing protein (plasmid) [Sulfitobacter sp. OXR-159]|uniref:methyltransferase domain-containing protein n=1 Tax=Sulfitobacter sp. OXR-159 TaxID=3100174 RepID=UPI002AC9002B|nr:methyltransferase domain-containing protein [Sulfitobacter sp. OXR-159]WPZ31695.1 methyltransferase domain-containing protein [Sulfitobacter sp. OXR-159]
MSHIYSDTFFNYIDQGARRSAREILALLAPQLQPTSVIDFGAGRGVWLDEWRKAGAQDILAVDGDYVDRHQLAVPQENFMPANLTAPVHIDRRFDLAQSLEVGEHLPPSAAETFVDSLTRSSDRILFSAAVTGQGGEFHVNEQPLSYWQKLFEARGYTAYDCVRPHLSSNRNIEPWYRYNTILYVNDAGLHGLPAAIAQHQIPNGASVQNGGNIAWKLRRFVVSRMPQNAVTQIAQLRAKIIAARAHGKTGAT